MQSRHEALHLFQWLVERGSQKVASWDRGPVVGSSLFHAERATLVEPACTAPYRVQAGSDKTFRAWPLRDTGVYRVWGSGLTCRSFLQAHACVSRVLYFEVTPASQVRVSGCWRFQHLKMLTICLSSFFSTCALSLKRPVVWKFCCTSESQSRMDLRGIIPLEFKTLKI